MACCYLYRKGQDGFHYHTCIDFFQLQTLSNKLEHFHSLFEKLVTYFPDCSLHSDHLLVIMINISLYLFKSNTLKKPVYLDVLKMIKDQRKWYSQQKSHTQKSWQKDILEKLIQNTGYKIFS